MRKPNWRVVNSVTFFRKFESRMYCVINSFNFVSSIIMGCNTVSYSFKCMYLLKMFTKSKILRFSTDQASEILAKK